MLYRSQSRTATPTEATGLGGFDVRRLGVFTIDRASARLRLRSDAILDRAAHDFDGGLLCLLHWNELRNPFWGTARRMGIGLKGGGENEKFD